MPLTGEAKKEYNKKYYKKAEKDAKTDKHDEIVEKILNEVDKAGERHLSEVLSNAQLDMLYRSMKIATQLFLGESLDFTQWLAMRDKARKDLFWLGCDVLKKSLVKTTHQVVCDLFVKKNFDGKYKEGYNLRDVHLAIDSQDREKEMLCLDPRGFYKSTIDGIDCVQWIINVPDIRILILTGEYKLASAFMEEIKGYFSLAKGAEFTDFQILFPEFCLTGVDGDSAQPIKCPVRQCKQKEPTLWVNAIVANLSGWHCDVKKGDDVVTDENSNTSDARDKLKAKYNGTGDLLDEWGFSDHIGTRYFPDDWYGYRLGLVEEDPMAGAVRYHCRACWEVKPGYSEVPLKDLTEEMVILNFPEKATFASLRRKLILKGERSFRNQQLNEPLTDEVSTNKVIFLEDILRKHLIPRADVPKQGDIFVVWDWASTASVTSDYSAGVAGMIAEKEGKQIIYILEVVFGRFRPSELAFQMVALSKKHNPRKTLIEKSVGAELLQLEIRKQAERFSASLDPFWKPPSTQENAKRNRIKGLEILLNDDRLYFVNGSWIDETFLEFTRYTGEKKNKGRKDDIPDAISYMTFFLPDDPCRNNEDYQNLRKEQEAVAARKAQYDRIFGVTADAPISTNSDYAEPEQTNRGMFGIPNLRIK